MFISFFKAIWGVVFQKLGGSNAYETASPYTGHRIVEEMQSDLAAVCRQKTFERIKQSPFLGIMVDESLDIAVQKKLVIYCKIAHLGEAKVEFGVNVEVENGTALTVRNAIMTFLEENDLNVHKVTGLGTDGAAAMIGRIDGVAVKMKRENPKMVSTWCVAHRLALVAHWAAMKVDYLKTVQTTLVNVYTFFQYSAVRYNKLRQLKSVMNVQVKKFRKPTQVRWLSLQESVLAVISAWGVLVMTLEHEAVGTSVGAAQARGILKSVKPFKFIASLHVLADALDAICACNRVFQKDVLDIVVVDGMLKATLDTVLALADHPGQHTSHLLRSIGELDSFQGIGLNPSEQDMDQLKSLTTRFAKNVREEVGKRFPDEDMQVMHDLATVLDPRKLPSRNDGGFHDHGKEELNRLLERYNEPVMGIDGDSANNSFLQFKFFLSQHRGKTLAEMCKVLIQAGTFPDFAQLAAISLTLPLTSVPCERGFSAQNLVHTALRNALSVASIHNKMSISHEAKQENFDQSATIQKACDLFKGNRKRSVAKTGE